MHENRVMTDVITIITTRTGKENVLLNKLRTWGERSEKNNNNSSMQLSTLYFTM